MTGTPFFIVAIDGGAASGKSSSAQALSERFDLLHADTGSYYRAVTAELLRLEVPAGNPEAVGAALPGLSFGTRVTGRRAEIEIGGRTFGREIRSAAVNAAVSHYSALPAVRAVLLDYQRGQADVAKARGFRGLAMEGRDIGSVIFPRADFRFFLSADPAERALRRAREGHHDAVEERDRIDSSRATAPLACPSGATAIDTTGMDLGEVVERMSRVIEARIARA
jgi:cytidylate kinase